jgi:hypothetical protein
MFFEAIYRWFASLFGGDLADYLSGYICPSDETQGGYLGSNQYVLYGVAALGVALLAMIIYYYVINHPRLNSWWSWLFTLLSAGVVNLFIGALMTRGDLSAGDIGDCLVNGANGGVYDVNCWMFGLANFVVSSMWFIVFSLAFKWWSNSCKRTPF